MAPGARQPEKGRDDFGSQTCNLEVLGVEDLHQIARNRAVKPRSLERAGADVSGTEGGGVAVGEAGDAGTEKQGGGDGNDLQKFLHDVSSLKGMERPCYSARETGLNVREGPLVLFPESVKFVVLKSALEDFEGSTLSAVPGLLGKLRYLARLYTRGVYSHWGMEKVYGSGAAERAMRTLHGSLVAKVLRTPLRELASDLQESAAAAEMTDVEVLSALERPGATPGQEGSRAKRMGPSERHFKSVLRTLAALVQSKEPASRRDASPLLPPGR